VSLVVSHVGVFYRAIVHTMYIKNKLKINALKI